jgi:uncharacterized protein YjbJ (UPF0337 family)
MAPACRWRRGRGRQIMKKEDLTERLTRVKGILMELWGEVTGDAEEFDAGRRERVIAALEEKYGLSRREAEEELEKHIRGG